MIRINLLPHREEKRKLRRQQFYAFAVASLVLGAVVVLFGFQIYSSYITRQDEQNQFLQAEIAKLNKQIDEIKRLKEQTDALLERKRIIESLQGNRNEAVSVFNELARQMPEGVYLKSCKQSGVKLTLGGYAQSQARVSSLLRNLEGSNVFEKPELGEIKVANVDKRRLFEYNLSVTIKRVTEDKKAGGKPGAGQKS
ncbi:MAG: PilN domain-containing protein [Rhodocyclaceae bacterium]|nr:PilN domain-containing protein [Rhodocyclaceae bacterium]MBX3670404.1 PilN domain-containing protein [Rhodocyclaceae bacterium]